MNDWKAICSLEDIPRLGSRMVKSTGGDIALFRTGDDRVFALDDRCPHKGGPLSQGIVAGERVACPMHGWLIGLENGNAVAPDRGCVKSHEARVDAGKVLLRIT